jgi:hypothetical protein
MTMLADSTPSMCNGVHDGLWASKPEPGELLEAQELWRQIDIMMKALEYRDGVFQAYDLKLRVASFQAMAKGVEVSHAALISRPPDRITRASKRFVTADVNTRAILGRKKMIGHSAFSPAWHAMASGA